MGEAMNLIICFPVKWRRLIRESDLIAGRVQVRKVQRDLVGVVKVHDQIYVFDGRCPHAGRSLHGCEVNSGGVMECPSHGLRLRADFSAMPGPRAIPVTQLTFRLSDGIVEISRGARRRKPSPGETSLTGLSLTGLSLGPRAGPRRPGSSARRAGCGSPRRRDAADRREWPGPAANCGVRRPGHQRRPARFPASRWNRP